MMFGQQPYVYQQPIYNQPIGQPISQPMQEPMMRPPVPSFAVPAPYQYAGCNGYNGGYNYGCGNCA